MGITGLLPLLKPVTKDSHVRELQGLVSTAVDGTVLIIEAAFTRQGRTRPLLPLLLLLTAVRLSAISGRTRFDGRSCVLSLCTIPLFWWLAVQLSLLFMLQTVGIDTYCWLHKGIYSCSAELCQGLPTDKFIKFCVER